MALAPLCALLEPDVRSPSRRSFVRCVSQSLRALKWKELILASSILLSTSLDVTGVPTRCSCTARRVSGARCGSAASAPAAAQRARAARASTGASVCTSITPATAWDAPAGSLRPRRAGCGGGKDNVTPPSHHGPCGDLRPNIPQICATAGIATSVTSRKPQPSAQAEVHSASRLQAPPHENPDRLIAAAASNPSRAAARAYESRLRIARHARWSGIAAVRRATSAAGSSGGAHLRRSIVPLA